MLDEVKLAVTGRFAAAGYAAAHVNPSYLPSGANVHPI